MVDPEFYNGTNRFLLSNGDTFIGEFCAHRNGKIWREGQGVYYTHDGHVYAGLWKDDKLIDCKKVTIKYPNDDLWEGILIKNKYEGNGSITFNEGLCLLGTFRNNKPIGAFHLFDLHGQLWKGESGSSENIAYCRQENIFFNNIHPLRGLKKDKLKAVKSLIFKKIYKPVSDVGEESISQESMCISKQEMEKNIFSEKPKVNTWIDWKNTPWYHNFAKYKETREIILEKIRRHERLSDKENIWYRKYALSKKHQRTAQLRSEKSEGKVCTTLVETFYSKEHTSRSKPFATFYPTYYWRTLPKPKQEDEGFSFEEETTEEETLTIKTDQELEEEKENITEYETLEILQNISIACGTKSLFNFVQETTGITKKINSKSC